MKKLTVRGLAAADSRFVTADAIRKSLQEIEKSQRTVLEAALGVRARERKALKQTLASLQIPSQVARGLALGDTRRKGKGATLRDAARVTESESQAEVREKQRAKHPCYW